MASINGENTDTNGLERTKTECSGGESPGNPWSSSRTCFKENESFLFDAETRRTQSRGEQRCGPAGHVADAAMINFNSMPYKDESFLRYVTIVKSPVTLRLCVSASLRQKKASRPS